MKGGRFAPVRAKRAQQPRARARVQSAQIAWALKLGSRTGDAGLGPCRRPKRPPGGGGPAALAPRARRRWRRCLHWPHAIRAPSWGGRAALSTSPSYWRAPDRRGPGNSNCPMQAPAGGHSDLNAGAVKDHWHGPTCQRAFGAACGAVTFELNEHRGLQRPSSRAFVTGCMLVLSACS